MTYILTSLPISNESVCPLLFPKLSARFKDFLRVESLQVALFDVPLNYPP